jgi:hypothetical protein
VIAARAVGGRLREFVLVAAPAAIGSFLLDLALDDPLSG